MSTCRIDEEFFNFTKPIFPGISENLFEAVKESYGVQVLEAVSEAAHEEIDDTKYLVNQILLELATTLARQRRDYSVDVIVYDFPFIFLDTPPPLRKTRLK